MTLKRTSYTNSHGWHYSLTHCPACDKELREGKHKAMHIMSHDPIDFGLSPLNND
jgi:hypothetical protein